MPQKNQLNAFERLTREQQRVARFVALGAVHVIKEEVTRQEASGPGQRKTILSVSAVLFMHMRKDHAFEPTLALIPSNKEVAKTEATNQAL